MSSLSYLFYILSCILSYINIILHSILMAFNSSSLSPSIVHPTDFPHKLPLFLLCQMPIIFYPLRLPTKITSIGSLNFSISQRDQDLLGFLFDGSNPCPPVNNITTPNLALLPWILRDQLLMSPLISSLSNKPDDTLPLVVSLTTSHEIQATLESSLAFASNTHIFQIHMHLQSLKQGDLLVTQFPHKAYSFADELTPAGMPISTQKFNICVFKGLKPDFHYLVTTLATFSSPISFQKFTQSPPQS